VAIKIKSPVLQPVVYATEYWINNVNIIAPSPTEKARARITATPFDPHTGIMAGDPIVFTVDDLFGAAMATPVTGFYVADAVQSLITAVEELMIAKGLAKATNSGS
jgi:hypothetical protein